MTGHYPFVTSNREMLLKWDMPHVYTGCSRMTMQWNGTPLYKSNVHPEYCYIPDGVDWDFLDSLILTE